MTPSSDRRLAFAHALRRHVPQGTLRETARRLDPMNPERGKRNLNRYLAAKVMPSRPMLYALEEALGLDSGSLADEFAPDDEEPDSVSMEAELFGLTRDLAEIQRRVRKLTRAAS
jgi:hypothetical protein